MFQYRLLLSSGKPSSARSMLDPLPGGLQQGIAARCGSRTLRSVVDYRLPVTSLRSAIRSGSIQVSNKDRYSHRRFGGAADHRPRYRRMELMEVYDKSAYV